MNSILDEINRINRLDEALIQRGTRSKKARLLARAVKSRRDWCCHICGRAFHHITEATIDHIIPLSTKAPGADHVVDVACQTCNSRRGNVPIVMYRMFQIMKDRFPTIVNDEMPGPKELRRRARRGLRRKQVLSRRTEQCILDTNQDTV